MKSNRNSAMSTLPRVSGRFASRSLFLAIAATALWMASPQAKAADASYNGGTGVWNNNALWTPAMAPGAVGTTNNTDTATFGALSGTSILTVDAGRNIENIAITAAINKALTITGGSLLLTDGGTLSTAPAAGETISINTPMTLEGELHLQQQLRFQWFQFGFRDGEHHHRSCWSGCNKYPHPNGHASFPRLRQDRYHQRRYLR